MTRALLFVILLSGCSFLRAAIPAVVDCTAQSALSGADMQRLGDALRSEQSASLLDQLLGELGSTLICAIGKITGAQPTEIANPDEQVMRQRAAAWLRTRGYQTKGIP